MTDTKSLAKAARSLQAAATDLAAAIKTLDKLEPDLDRQAFAADEALRDAEKALRTLAPVADTLRDARALTEALRARVDPAMERSRAALAAALARELSALGLPPLEGNLPELRCGALTLELLFDKAEARVWFGPRIELLGKARLDAAAVAAAAKGALDALSGPLDEAAFVAELHDAWVRACRLAAQDPGAGTTVSLIAVLDQLAWGRQSARFRANPTREAFTGYGRVQLAWDLYRLGTRRHGDLELKLTVATREQTRTDTDSLWVPRTARGEGTHFAGLAFRRLA